MRTTYPELDSITISCDNIVIIFKDTIMKNTFASLLVLVFAIFSSFAQAGSVPFEGGVITYEKGSMDSRDYNGTIEGVTFEFDTGEKAYADRLTLETSPVSSPPSFKIDRFLVRNFTFEADGITMAIASLSLRDTIIRGENPDFRMLIETGKIEQAIMQTGRMEMFGFLLAEDSAETFTVDKMVVQGTPIEVAGIGNLPIQSGELIIENMVYIPAYGSGYQGMNPKEFGLDRIEMDVEIVNNATDKADRVNNIGHAKISMEGLGEISMKMDVGMLKGSLMAFQQYTENPDNYEDEAFMMMVLTGIFINSAEFSMNDEGALSIIFDDMENDTGKTRMEFVTELMREVALAIGPAAPQTYAAFEPALREFLEEGGELTLKLNPMGPVPMTSFMSFIAAPDTALTVLGLNLEQTRR